MNELTPFVDSTEQLNWPSDSASTLLPPRATAASPAEATRPRIVAWGDEEDDDDDDFGYFGGGDDDDEEYDDEDDDDLFDDDDYDEEYDDEDDDGDLPGFDDDD